MTGNIMSFGDAIKKRALKNLSRLCPHRKFQAVTAKEAFKMIDYEGSIDEDVAVIEPLNIMYSRWPITLKGRFLEDVILGGLAKQMSILKPAVFKSLHINEGLLAPFVTYGDIEFLSMGGNFKEIVLHGHIGRLELFNSKRVPKHNSSTKLVINMAEIDEIVVSHAESIRMRFIHDDELSAFFEEARGKENFSLSEFLGRMPPCGT